MRGSGQSHLRAPDRAAEALAYPALLCGRLHRLWCALARRAVAYGQGGDAWHRAGQRPPATLAGPDWLARFRRRSIVVSKAKRMVDVSIALFARFAGNDRIVTSSLCSPKTLRRREVVASMRAISKK